LAVYIYIYIYINGAERERERERQTERERESERGQVSTEYKLNIFITVITLRYSRDMKYGPANNAE